MSEATKEAEAQAASVAFQLALIQLGVGTLDEALDAWADVASTPSQVAPTAGKWLTKAIELVLSRRSRSRELAMAYYRLVRALRTGTTVADWRHPEPEYVTLGTLRHEFKQLVEEQGTPYSTSERGQTVLQRNMPDGELPEPVDGSESDDEERIYLEELKQLEEEEKAADKAAEDELRATLEQLGYENLRRKMKAIDGGLSAEEADALRDKAHADAGVRQAAGAERVSLDGGRGQLWRVMQADVKIIGYVRVSRTGTPCGWCAMLISRGFVPKSVAYSTQKSAGPTKEELDSGTYDDGDKYHDNCHCYAEPIYSEQQYESDPRFDLNRKYAELWPEVTAGYGGKAALTVWRRYIRQQQAHDRAAQEAA